MPSLSLNIGLNNVRKLPFGGGAAPSGIPVASTNTIIIVDTDFHFNGIYQKESSTFYRNEAEALISISWDSTQWTLADVDTYLYVYATPPSNNINYIATTGWPTQTLTAA